MSIMSITKRDPICIGPEATVLSAAVCMAERNVGALLVMEGARLRGIITERDILRKVTAAGRDPATTTVGEVATERPVVAPPTATLADCYQILKAHDFRHLPILTNDGKPVGIVSSRDFLRFMVLGFEEHVDIDAICAQLSTFSIDLLDD